MRTSLSNVASNEEHYETAGFIIISVFNRNFIFKSWILYNIHDPKHWYTRTKISIKIDKNQNQNRFSGEFENRFLYFRNRFMTRNRIEIRPEGDLFDFWSLRTFQKRRVKKFLFFILSFSLNWMNVREISHSRIIDWKFGCNAENSRFEGKLKFKFPSLIKISYKKKIKTCFIFWFSLRKTKTNWFRKMKFLRISFFIKTQNGCLISIQNWAILAFLQ